MSPSKLLHISRPRFWIYLLGPFAVGAIAAGTQADLSWPILWLAGLYFTFPANLLVYGVNDIFDYETDKDNPKKVEYEAFVTQEEHPILRRWILAVNLPFLGLLPFLPWESIVALGGFLFFSLQYSATPIRAKARPFIDSAFNILYIMPGLVGFWLLDPETALWPAIIAGGLWSMAMHSYSAVPDIDTDKKAKTYTIATSLGFNNTLLYCATLYGVAYLLVVPYLGILAHILGFVYLGLMLLTLLKGQEKSFGLYTIFPKVNTVAGFLLFWMIVWIRFT